MTPHNGKGWIVESYFGGDGDVGQEHILFNHEMGIHVLVLRNVSGILALIIELELYFWRAESQGTCLESSISEDSGNFEHVSETNSQISVISRIINHILSLVISQALATSDDRLSKLNINSLETLTINFKKHAKRAPINMTNQGAKTLSKQLWKHISPPINHVNSGASSGSFSIDVGASPDEMGHISDVHSDLVITVF